MTNDESLAADRYLAMRIIWTIYQAPAGVMDRAALYERFPDVDNCRIDAVLEDLADVVDSLTGAVFLLPQALANIVEAMRAACQRLAEEAVDE